MAEVCPVVGTTNTVLPPRHPEFDMNQPGQVCPVTKATTDHHHNLHKHPGIFPSEDLSNAESCPALTKIVSSSEAKTLDEAICPVVGAVTNILPPNHPSTSDSKPGDVCPVTNATLGHHQGKVHPHPNLQTAPKGAVCPVVHQAADE